MKGFEARELSASDAEGSVDVSVRVESEVVPLVEETDSVRAKARVPGLPGYPALLESTSGGIATCFESAAGTPWAVRVRYIRRSPGGRDGGGLEVDCLVSGWLVDLEAGAQPSAEEI